MDRRHGQSFRRARTALFGDMVFSAIIKAKVVNTLAFFFKIRNLISGNGSKIHGTVISPGGRGILKSSSKRA